MNVPALSFLLWTTAYASGTATPPPSVPATDPPAVEETVIVTATRSERAASRLPVSATVLDEKALLATPARSVDDLLREVPGVHLSLVSASGSTPNNQRVSMRGLGGSRALVLLDGVPLHDPYSGVAQWQKVPLGTLSQVEVVRGGNASLFGNFALGGTIHLITRPVDGRRLSLDASYGSGSTARAALTVDHPLTPSVGLRLSHHRSDSAGFFRVPDPGPIDVEAWADNTVTSLRADYRPSDRTRAFLNANRSTIDFSQGTPSSYSKRDLTGASGGVHRSTGSNSALSANVFVQRQSERLVNSSISALRDSEFVSQDGAIPSDAVGASVEWSTQRSGALRFISFGVDVQKMAVAEERVTFSRTGPATQSSRVTGAQRFAGVFAQGSWSPDERLEVLASARLDSFRNYDGSDVVAGGTASYYPARSSQQLDPRVSARYIVGRHSTVRASAYRAFNAPALRDLYRNNQSGSSIILGNPDLQPETLLGGEIGWEWAGAAARYEVNVHRSVIEGVQARTQVAGRPSNVFHFQNLGTSRSQGVEASADVRLSARWSATAGYTWADSVVIADPNPELLGKRIPEVPEHTGTVSVRYRGLKGTRADLRARVLSRSYGESANLAVSPAHRVVDLSVGQLLRGGFEVYALLENAFDEEYYLALTATAHRSGLPRTLTFGVRLELGR